MTQTTSDDILLVNVLKTHQYDKCAALQFYSDEALKEHLPKRMKWYIEWMIVHLILELNLLSATQNDEWLNQQMQRIYEIDDTAIDAIYELQRRLKSRKDQVRWLKICALKQWDDIEDKMFLDPTIYHHKMLDALVITCFYEGQHLEGYKYWRRLMSNLDNVSSHKRFQCRENGKYSVSTLFQGQKQEDKYLYDKYFSKYSLVGPKFYFEAGALDGELYTNTKFFEKWLDWTGLLVEANPLSFVKLVENRPKNILVNALIGTPEDPLHFQISHDFPAVCGVPDTQLSSNNLYFKHGKVTKFKTIPSSLDHLMKHSGIQRFDLVVLDVEGHELQVLQSFSFEVPTVLWMIERLPSSQDYEHIENLMSSKGFIKQESVFHNDIYIHKDFVKYFDLS